jgi:glycine cleavage system T protein
MPIQYPTGAVAEHRLCRRSVGLFDIDHMGQVIISGEGASQALSSLVSNRILDMKPNASRYSLLLNDRGGIIDDIFIYRSAYSENDDKDDAWFVVVNAGNRETDIAHFRENLPEEVSVEDVSDVTYMIAAQGPRAVELIDLLSNGAVSAIPRGSMAVATVAGVPVVYGRTGYTGEDGVELFYDPMESLELWELLISGAREAEIEVGPVGLAARDSLRFEAGMPLHGHEIAPTITPLEARLSWACDFQKEFKGKAALLSQKAAGLSRILVTLNVTGGVPREGYPVLSESGEEIGRCVAGMFCPTVGTYSANAFVPPAYSAPDTKLAVLIRGVPKEAVVVKRPLYTPAYRQPPAVS